MFSFWQASQIFEPFLDLSLPLYEEKKGYRRPLSNSKSMEEPSRPEEQSNHQRKKMKKLKKQNRVRNELQN